MEHRVALITGASRNLGRVMATALLKEGLRVVLTSTTHEALDQTVGASGAAEQQAVAITADLSDPDDRRRLIDRAHSAFGRIDVLVNNAAMTPEHYWPDFPSEGEPPPWTMSEERLQRFLEVNVVAPHILSSAFVPNMIAQGWGRIVNVSTSLDTMLRFWPYGATKAALEAETAVLAKALAKTGVTANALLPGGRATATPSGSQAHVASVLSPTIMAHPLRWLASEASDGVTGRRFIAARWDPASSPNAAAEQASTPVAWTGLGVSAVTVPSS